MTDRVGQLQGKAIFSKVDQDVRSQILQTDLLQPSAYHYCSICSVPLTKFTRVIAKRIDDESVECGFRNRCVPCFLGWSNSGQNDGLQQKEATYKFIVQSQAILNNENEEFTNIQIYALFQIVSKFGIDSWTNIQRQYAHRIGKNISEANLEQFYFQYYDTHFRNTDIDFFRKTPLQTISPPKSTSLFRPLNYLKMSEQEEIYAKQFYGMIRHLNSIPHLRQYAENIPQYFCHLLLGCKGIKRRYSSSGKYQQLNASNSEMVRHLTKWQRQSQIENDKIQKANKSLCKLFIHMAKRHARKDRTAHKTKPSKQFEFKTNPQLSRLQMNSSLNQKLQQILNLKQRKEELVKRSRELDRQQLQQRLRTDQQFYQDYMEKKTRKTKKRGRVLQHQKQRQYQSPPRRISRSFNSLRQSASSNQNQDPKE